MKTPSQLTTAADILLHYQISAAWVDTPTVDDGIVFLNNSHGTARVQIAQGSDLDNLTVLPALALRAENFLRKMTDKVLEFAENKNPITRIDFRLDEQDFNVLTIHRKSGGLTRHTFHNIQFFYHHLQSDI